MAVNATVDTYLRQWLYTAGDFQLDYAWQTNRMQLRCKCGAILRYDCLTKTDEIPWALQDWVSTHGHNGTHGKDVGLKPILKVELAPVPLTVDFKKVKLATAKIVQSRRFR